MCGIAGIVRFDGAEVPPGVIEAMTTALMHRGPDGEGIWRHGSVALGHRRLAIIDLTTGNQPMSNEDGAVTVTYNGEIYDYLDLRRDLEGKGHRFRSESDTEVLIHAYEQWDGACVEHFRGMFAFCIADLRRGCLFLARDHLGIKPLYYLAGKDFFAFASELSALKCIPNQPFTPSLAAMDQYLWLRYIPAPATIYAEAKKLCPATRMWISFDGKIRGPEEYWRLRFSPDGGRSQEEWLEALDGVLRESVQVHLVADVPFGAFLSGGVDSTTVVCHMAEALGRPVSTFTIGFDDAEYDETRFAASVAERLGTKHHVEIVRPDALALLPRLTRHYGEPFGDDSAIPTWHLSELAPRQVPMVLSGDGGDEAFAGYREYARWLSWLEGGTDSAGRKAPFRRVAHRLSPSLFGRRTVRSVTLDNWLRFVGFVGPLERYRLWRPEYTEGQSGLDGRPWRRFLRQ